MRWPVPRLNWWKVGLWDEVAVYSLTGTVTRPKLIAPVQIARAISSTARRRRARLRL
jgi:hypothetical protein